MNRNALNASVREIDLGIDTRNSLSNRQATEISRWHKHPTDLVEQRCAREETARLASAVKETDRQLKENKRELSSLGEELALGLGLESQPGFGPVTVGAIIVAYSQHGHIRSESAFAAMVGTAPLQASSGNTVRHRLNRHGRRDAAATNTHCRQFWPRVRWGAYSHTKVHACSGNGQRGRIR